MPSSERKREVYFMSAYTPNIKKDIEAILEPDKSFDILKRSFTLTYASEATFYYIDGFTKGHIHGKNIRAYAWRVFSGSGYRKPSLYRVRETRDINTLIKAVLSGQAIFIIDGSDDAFMIDTRVSVARNCRT